MFLYKIAKFNFSLIYKVIQSLSKNNINYQLTPLLNILSTYLIKEPIIPINNSCKPVPLLNRSIINCSAYPSACNGIKHNTSVKVAYLTQLGFDVDVLEIQLRELIDVVDYIFIIESTRTHFMQNRKILTWEYIRNQQRFILFSEKVVHLTLDDVESMADDVNSKYIWHLEHLQLRTFLRRLKARWPPAFSRRTFRRCVCARRDWLRSGRRVHVFAGRLAFAHRHVF